MLKVVIIGNSEMLYNLIRGVKSSDNAEIVAVIDWDKVKKKTFLQKFSELFFDSYIQKYIKVNNLQQIKTTGINSETLKKQLLQINPDIMLVGTWGEKISKEIFSIPKIATINLHPSLLPKYRGPNPYSQVIIHGENYSGLTFHLMSEKYDEGAILLQKQVEILNTDNAQSLKTRICSIIPEAICELLGILNNNVIEPQIQDENQASYYSHVKPEDIIIKPSEMTYNEIDCKIRGLSPWQSSYLEYKNMFFKIRDYKLTDTYIKCKTDGICCKTKDYKFILFSNLEIFDIEFCGFFKKVFSKIILTYLHYLGKFE